MSTIPKKESQGPIQATSLAELLLSQGKTPETDLLKLFAEFEISDYINYLTHTFEMACFYSDVDHFDKEAQIALYYHYSLLKAMKNLQVARFEPAIAQSIST